MLHTSLIAAIYYNLAVVLFSLISLSCSRGGSVIGIRDRTGLGGSAARTLRADLQTPAGTGLGQEHCEESATTLVTLHRRGPCSTSREIRQKKKKKKKRKSQQTGSAVLFNSLRPGAVCIAGVTVSLSEWSHVLEEQDGNRQGEADLVTDMSSKWRTAPELTAVFWIDNIRPSFLVSPQLRLQDVHTCLPGTTLSHQTWRKKYSLHKLINRFNNRFGGSGSGCLDNQRFTQQPYKRTCHSCGPPRSSCRGNVRPEVSSGRRSRWGRTHTACRTQVTSVRMERCRCTVRWREHVIEGEFK